MRLGWSTELPVIQCSSSRTTPSTIQHYYTLVKDEKGLDPALDKIDLLVDHFLQTSGGRPALVFIHRGAKIDHFVWNLRRRGMRVVALYEKMNNSEEYREFLARFQAGQIQLAVGTEETVRGLDFPGCGQCTLWRSPAPPKSTSTCVGGLGVWGGQGRQLYSCLAVRCHASFDTMPS